MKTLFKHNQNQGDRIIEQGLAQARQNGGRHTAIITITPEIAGDFQAHGWEENREIRSSKIIHYARLMAEGKWTLSESVICFSLDGQMFNGHHRMIAVQQANATINAIVLFGATREEALNYDRGANRSSGDILRIHGRYANYNQIAAVANAAIRWERRVTDKLDWTTSIVDPDELARYADEHHELLYQACHAAEHIHHRLKVNKTSAAMAWLICSAVSSQEEATGFLRRVAEGVLLEPGSAELALQRRLLNNAAKQTRNIRGWEQTFLIIKAWNAYRKARKIKTIVWSVEEGVPEAV